MNMKEKNMCVCIEIQSVVDVCLWYDTDRNKVNDMEEMKEMKETNIKEFYGIFFLSSISV